MTSTTPSRATYLLVCRDASRLLGPQLSPTEMGTLLHEWLQWHESLQASGRLRFSSPVEAESDPVCNRFLPSDQMRRDLARPLIGYLLVEAESLEDATEIARGCPGLRRGFVIEVYRPFERFSECCG